MPSTLQRQAHAVATKNREDLRTLGSVVGFLWALELVDLLVFGSALDSLGIRPRLVTGLVGILLAPLLHGGLAHLLANSLSLVVLGWLSMRRKRMDFWVIGVVSAVVAGLGTWLFGQAGSIHIGASGVVFGMLGFLLTRGFFERSVSTVLLSGAVFWIFGGMLWGVLPTVGPGISWEGHLFGFVGGVLVARVLGRERRARRR